MKGYAYKITNTETNKVYVGATQNINRRWDRHKRDLVKNRHHCQPLQDEFNLHGLSKFIFEIVEEFEFATLQQKYFFEQKWLDNTINLYNVCKIAGSHLGRKNKNKKDPKEASRLRQRKWVSNNREKQNGLTKQYRKSLADNYIINMLKTKYSIEFIKSNPDLIQQTRDSIIIKRQKRIGKT